ncbi:putative DNA-binding transcriptional regulator YafY [Sphaerotilus hippei]|uniref:Putative DNA-binding transcriptional regulator YafY n=1 Tax=Sphaerotilus hippei TaxID=744406 RepID=A0A318HCK4_9BURK|nr:WYL domain-containing protein [Sphaerotilus hippei]PXW98705.1 putative DNA-binding transcriptional regulator YafY [Sphaerotilus hippei]
MSRRPGNLETLLLSIELLKRIPRQRQVTAVELHRQLADIGMQRELRTIQRQLDQLSQHFEIERDERSKPYGYRWKALAQGLSLPLLGEHESLLLALAEQHLRNLLPASLLSSMEGFFTQARVNLGPAAGARRERDWLSKVRVVSSSQPLLAPRLQPGVFEQVSNALYGNRWLQLDYVNAAGTRRQADFMPLGLAQQGPCLYLVGRFRGFDNERSLALHRIRSATASTLTFERPADFELQRYDSDGRFGFGEGRRITLSFEISRPAGQHLLETPLSTDQQVEVLPDGHLHLVATVIDTERLTWWLRGFGDEVRQIVRTPCETPVP